MTASASAFEPAAGFASVFAFEFAAEDAFAALSLASVAALSLASVAALSLVSVAAWSLASVAALSLVPVAAWSLASVAALVLEEAAADSVASFAFAEMLLVVRYANYWNTWIHFQLENPEDGRKMIPDSSRMKKPATQLIQTRFHLPAPADWALAAIVITIF